MEAYIDKPERILIEQITVLYKYLFPILAINALVGGAMIYGLWDVVPKRLLMTWAVVGLIIIFIRALPGFYYRKSITTELVNRQAILYTIGAGLMGLHWGIGAMVLFPASQLEYQLFILFILAAMGAGAASSYNAYTPAFLAYFPASTFPICIVLFSFQDSIHTSLGVMTIAYILVVSFFAMSMNRNFIQSLKLRYENIELVEQLKAQKEEAEHANIAKSRFLAAASHDLRQPLHALVLFTSVLDETIQNTKSRHVLEQIKSSIAALQDLFNALLDISKLEAGIMVVEKTDFNLAMLTQKLKNDFLIAAEEKNLSLEFKQCNFIVHSDPALLEQVLRNYISNAINYTKRGGITVSCEEQGKQININTADTGIGIPAEKQSQIFQEFYQIGNPERDRRKGLGLGLAIVHRVAKLLGHEIQISSQPGKGSVFSITTDKSENLISHLAADTTTSKKPTLVSNLNIIVIDDEISAQQGMCSLLETWNCSAFAFSNVEEAIAELEKNHYKPDGIITDFRLKDGMTGIDAIQQIYNKLGKKIPALIVTGDTAKKCLLEVQEKGYQLLHKPVQPLKLRAFLQHLA